MKYFKILVLCATTVCVFTFGQTNLPGPMKFIRPSILRRNDGEQSSVTIALVRIAPNHTGVIFIPSISPHLPPSSSSTSQLSSCGEFTSEARARNRSRIISRCRDTRARLARDSHRWRSTSIQNSISTSYRTECH